jgi:hypothetical protein
MDKTKCLLYKFLKKNNFGIIYSMKIIGIELIVWKYIYNIIVLKY